MANKNLPFIFQRTFAAFGLALLMFCGASVKAQQFYTAAVSSYNNFPFNGSTSSGNMCQFLYFPSDFNSTPSGGNLITTIYWKAATTGSTTYTNFTIKMANSSLTSLPTGATTWNSGLTTVISQSSFSSTWTSGNWYAITLPTPFYYSGGNLLVEASQTGLTSTGMGVWYYSGSVNKRMYGTTVSTTSTGADVSPLSFGFDVIPATCSGTPIVPNITTAAMNAASPIGCGGTFTLSAFDPNAPITNMSYTWESSLSSSGPFTTVTGGSGATTTTYTTGALNAPTWFRFGVKCNGSGITSYSAPYQVLVGAPQPGVISGRPTFCPGDTATYSVPAGPAGTTYNWTLPAGWGGASTTNSILTTMGGGTSAVTISVTANAACVTATSVARTRTLLPGSAPATPAAINGFNAVCAYTTQTYSVAPVAGANSYQWTLPGGWTGTSSGPSITLTTDNNSGTISVKAVNGCGSSTVASMAVSIINSLANPGTITSSAPGGVYCSGLLYTFSISPIPGATSYQWQLPTGWSGTVSGTSIQAFAGGAGSGQVKVTGLVSCATSATATLNTTVTNSVTPGVTVTPPPALCQGIPATFTATPTNGGTTPTYQWRKNGVNVFSTGNTYTDATLNSGDVISVRLTSTAACRSFDTVNSPALTAAITPSVTPGISINSTPVVTICAGTTLNFTTTITGGGTAPMYQWYVNTLPVATSANWSSSGFNNGDTVTVMLTTNAACATINTVRSNKVGIKVNALVSPSISVTATSTTANGQMVDFTAAQSGGGATPTYQWLLNGVDIPNATASTYSSDKLVPGDHISVRMVSYDPCANPGVVTSADVVMYGAAGVANAGGWQGALSLYPNPTVTGRVTVSAAWTGNHGAEERVTIDVVNTIGQSVYHSEVAPGSTSKGHWHYDVSLPETAPAGHYILRLNAVESGMRAALPFVLSR